MSLGLLVYVCVVVTSGCLCCLPADLSVCFCRSVGWGNRCKMRMANPKTPPKVLKHLKEGFVDKDRYDVYVQRKLWTFCESVWPSFGVWWTSVGSLDSQMIQAVWNVVTKDLPSWLFSLFWLVFFQDPTLWLKTCASCWEPKSSWFSQVAQRNPSHLR